MIVSDKFLKIKVFLHRMRKATGEALSAGLQWNKMALKQNQKLQVIFAALIRTFFDES